MTVRGQLMALFPGLTLGLIVASAAGCVVAPAWWTFLLLVFALYGFPLACFRLHQLAAPLREGWCALEDKVYIPWWGTYQIQQLYAALPWLEAPLRLVPGLYSAWLRLWGSRIGSGVFWPPEILISDRSLLEIGDGVVIGSRCELYAHMIVRRRAALQLYVSPIRIGDGVLIGAHTGIGPGAKIAPGTFLRVESRIFPNQRVTDVAPRARRASRGE
jgi:hypothetical protein